MSEQPPTQQWPPYWICPRCGQPNTPGTLFCVRCGLQLVANAPPPPPVRASGWRAWSTRKKLAIVGGIALIALLVIGAVAGPRRPDVALASPLLTQTPFPTLVAEASATLAATSTPIATASPPPVTPTPELATPTPAPATPTVEPATQTPVAIPSDPPVFQPTPEPESPFIEFFDGTWEIGVDIPPGTYRTTDYTFDCYWARLSGFSGDFEEIIANNFASGYQVVTIGRRDVGFESTGCGDWTSDLSQVTADDTTFEEGTYIVGTDIRPGTYEASGGDGCYWARLSGFSGEFDDIIANEFTDSQRVIATIRASDEGFTTSGCGVWTLR